MHVLRPLVLAMVLAVIGCDAGSSSGETSAASADRRANVEPASLFSEFLHEVSMPAAGHARLEFRGQVFEAALFADCTASRELPDDAPAWEAHFFAASPRFQMAGGNAILSFQRQIHPQEETWASAAHEQEIVTLTMPDGAGMYTYGMHRATPGAPAMIAIPMDQPAREAGPGDAVPGIRVHSDGHQATFVGQLGHISMTGISSDSQSEEARIAIHCGPV